MNGNKNLTNIMTKSRHSNTWSPLTKPLLFWSDRYLLKEQVVSEGNEKRSATDPLYQAKGTTQILFKIDLWHILGEYGS